MHLVDKLLLVLLLCMLPLGVIASKKLLATPSAPEKPNEIETLGQTLQQIADKQSGGSKIPEINITGVIASSESGTLTVAGQVPNENLTITVRATLLPDTSEPVEKKVTPSGISEEEVLGQSVELRAIKPMAGGSFTYKYPIKGLKGIIELEFEQGVSVIAVQYDLTHGKQIPLVEKP